MQRKVRLLLGRAYGLLDQLLMARLCQPDASNDGLLELEKNNRVHVRPAPPSHAPQPLTFQLSLPPLADAVEDDQRAAAAGPLVAPGPLHRPLQNLCKVRCGAVEAKTGSGAEGPKA